MKLKPELREDGYFCCLGRLCEIYRNIEKQREWPEDFLYPPDKIGEWAFESPVKTTTLRRTWRDIGIRNDC